MNEAADPLPLMLISPWWLGGAVLGFLGYVLGYHAARWIGRRGLWFLSRTLVVAPILIMLAILRRVDTDLSLGAQGLLIFVLAFSLSAGFFASHFRYHDG